MPSLKDRLRGSAARLLWRERGGAVALIFGLAALPIIGLVGLAIDFGFAAQAKAQLALAADTAAMQAATTAGNVYQTTADKNAAVTAATTQGETTGVAWFGVQAGKVLNTVVTLPATAVVTPTLTNNVVTGFTATVSYAASVSTTFAQLFGISTIAESGAATAVVSTAKYVNVTFLLDNSSSMNLVANVADIGVLQAKSAVFNANYPVGVFGNGATKDANGKLVPLGAPRLCAFACHWETRPGNAKDGTAGYTDDYYGVAQANGIQVRFDVLKSAVQQAVTTMAQSEPASGQFGIGVFEFNAPLVGQPAGPANSSLYEVYPHATNAPLAGQIAGTDLNAALAAANAITTPVSIDYANTLFGGPNGAMQKLSNLLPDSGSGTTAAQPQQALIIITDGIEDFLPNAAGLGRAGGRVIPGAEGNTFTGVEGPFSSDDCALARSKGVNVFVIYTTYFPDSRLLPFNIALLPYLQPGAAGGVEQALQACASLPQNFLKADDAAGIQTAMQTFLLAALRGAGRYSQ